MNTNDRLSIVISGATILLVLLAVSGGLEHVLL